MVHITASFQIIAFSLESIVLLYKVGSIVSFGFFLIINLPSPAPQGAGCVRHDSIIGPNYSWSIIPVKIFLASTRLVIDSWRNIITFVFLLSGSICCNDSRTSSISFSHLTNFLDAALNTFLFLIIILLSTAPQGAG